MANPVCQNLTALLPGMKVEIDAESIEIGIPKKEDMLTEDTNFVRNGKVSFFDTSKGFGFIIDSENQEKYFTHVIPVIF